MTQAKFAKEARQLAKILKSYTKPEIQTFFHISESQTELVYDTFRLFSKAEALPAFTTYSGAVFKSMKQEQFTDSEWEYINEYCYIFSALYGILRASDGVKPYRLDMKASPLEHQSLYHFWSDKVNKVLGKDILINLASSEFSKLIKRPHITIDFQEMRDGRYKRVATYAKMARGQFVAEMVKQKITDPETLKTISFDGYQFESTLSSDTVYTFVR